MHSSLVQSGSLSIILLLILATPGGAQTAPAQPAPETKVDASRGGITISSGVNSLTIGGRMQFRWTLDDRERADTDTAGSGRGDADGFISQFDVPRLRLSLSGGVYRPWLRYLFQLDFSRTPGESASKIKDAVIEVRPTGSSYRFQVGQFKAPFGLQQLTSSGRLQFVDRAITDSKFTPSREMGAMFAGTAMGRTLGYEAGVFNGSGESVRQNNKSQLVAGRVFWQPLGPYALSEGSSDAAARPVLHVGVGARTGEQIRGRTPTSTVEDPDDQTALNAEFAFKSRRIYSTAEYFWMTDEQQNPTAGRDIESRGAHVQAGYMVLPARADVGILFAQITPDADVDDAEITEVRGVVGYYWHAHGLKLQADGGRLIYEDRFSALGARARQGLPAPGTRLGSGRLVDTQVRVQFQVAF